MLGNLQKVLNCPKIFFSKSSGIPSVSNSLVKIRHGVLSGLVWVQTVDIFRLSADDTQAGKELKSFTTVNELDLEKIDMK